MIESLARLFEGFGPQVITIALATMPISELRGAIPWAYFVLKMPLLEALGWSLIGNALPVPIILALLDPIQRRLRRWAVAERFFSWLFARTRERGKAIERYGAIGLALFVGIPLPVTGAWTGVAAAYLFGIRFAPAIIAIYCGIIIAGGIIAALCGLGWAFTEYATKAVTAP